MKTNAIVAAVMLAVGVLGVMVIRMNSVTPPSSPNNERGTIQSSLTPQAFAEVLITDQDRTLVDVRTPAEYAAGHIAGASNIDFYEADFLEQFQDFDQDQPLAIYCRSGGRSGQALQALQAAGFSDVVDLSGGIMAWENAGQEVE